MAIGDEYFEGYLDGAAEDHGSVYGELVAQDPSRFPLWQKYRLHGIYGEPLPDSTQYSGFGHEQEVRWTFRWDRDDPADRLAMSPFALPFKLTLEVFDDVAETTRLFHQMVSGEVVVTITDPTPGVYDVQIISAYTFTHTITTDVPAGADNVVLDNNCPTEYDNGESMTYTGDGGYYTPRLIQPNTGFGERISYSGGPSFYEADIVFRLKSAPYVFEYHGDYIVKLSYEYFAQPLVSPDGSFAGFINIVYLPPTDDGQSQRQWKLRRGAPPSKFGMFTDIAGALHSAVNAGSSVQVYKFKDGLATREARSLLPNLKNPSYWSDDTGTRYICAQETLSTGTWYVYRSNGDGREFVQVASNWSDGYSGGNEFALVDGGAGSVKIKNNTDPAQVWFRRSPDGSVWPASAPYAPVLVGTLGADHKSITGHQKAESGESTIVVSNGYDKTWRSDANGAAGSWVLDS